MESRAFMQWIFVERKAKILHMLHWNIADITEHLPVIAKQGFTHIQITPVNGIKTGDEWWTVYQPTNFSIGNKYGSKEQLQELCSKAREYNIGIIVDIVLRHVAGAEDGSLNPSKEVDSSLIPLLSKQQIPCKDYNNRYECTHHCSGMPMFDYESVEYRNTVKRFLDELLECGVEMFRLDQAKHYTLPSEGGQFLQWLSDNYPLYGECIFCNQHILDQYAELMLVLTEGRPARVDRLIAKSDSHDDYLEFGWSKRMNDDMRCNEWDVLVNNNHFNSIYYCRPFEELWKSDRIRNINCKWL